jgi:hypothetical protein
VLRKSAQLTMALTMFLSALCGIAACGDTSSHDPRLDPKIDD